MIEFGIKDFLDILLVASLLFYVYRLMKESMSPSRQDMVSGLLLI